MPCGDVIAAAAGSITWHVHPIAGLAVSVNRNVQIVIVIGCGGGNAVKSDFESTSHGRKSAAEAQENKKGTLEKANLPQFCKIGFDFHSLHMPPLAGARESAEDLSSARKTCRSSANWDIGQWRASRVDCLADLQKGIFAWMAWSHISDFGRLCFLFRSGLGSPSRVVSGGRELQETPRPS